MDYGNLLSRAWTIVWEHKYLLVLGILAALSGGNSTTPGINYQTSGEDWQGSLNLMPGMGQFQPWMGVAAFAAIAIIGFFVVIGLLLWAVSQIARGGLIAGVDMIERSRDSTLGTAWQAGWQRGLTLIGIGLVPLIPALVLIGTALSVGVLFFGIGALFGGDGAAIRVAGGGVAAVFVAVMCITLPVVLVLALLSTFAYRSCMLEETGVWASYQRGWHVLRDNFGPALVIFVLQIGISVGLAIVLFIPSLIMTLCCLLWPILLLIQGVITAYFSTVWTLAWREWTGAQPAALDAAQ
jgi:hypothetical protein